MIKPNAKYLSLSLFEPEYARCWSGYRRLRQSVIFAFALAIVEARFVVYLPGLFVALTFMVYFILALCLTNWRCPQCQHSFFQTSFIRSLYGQRCANCGFPKWAVSEAGDRMRSPKFPFGWRDSVRSV